MVKVKLFGLFRLDTGIRELELPAERVKDLYPQLIEEAHRRDPASTVDKKYINGCVAAVNGKPANRNTRLNDGDTVYLTSPMAGG